jgi:ribosome biogenesis protein ERB1
MASNKTNKSLSEKDLPELDLPELAPVENDDGEGDDVVSSDADDSVYDSAEDQQYDVDVESKDDDDNEDFEDQGSSDEDDDLLVKQEDDEESEEEIEILDNLEADYEKLPRIWNEIRSGSKRAQTGQTGDEPLSDATTWMHTDDLSSDDEDDDATGNRIGRVPLHWYDEYEHIGYDVSGKQIAKMASSSAGCGDRLDQAIANTDNKAKGKFLIFDALNDKTVELSHRQLELIRRIQGGAFAHPEHDGNPEYIDYFSGVDPEVSGLSSRQYLPKARFQPSKWEELQVSRLLNRLEKGEITMEYLLGKNQKAKKDSNKPFLMWVGDEEDELNMQKGPQHIAAPKLPPPGHAESYIPPAEYIPTDEEVKTWEEMDVKDRPHGLLIPRKYSSLRSVGAYPHSVRETFERCLDLYLCPRVMKRRLNIDPESLVPRLPKAADLRPFPTAKCIEYFTPHDEKEAPPTIRCVSPSPDGQYMASGASDGVVRLWEVQTGRLLQSFDLSKVATDSRPQNGEIITKATTSYAFPVVCLEWNPNRSHHCLLAAIGKCVVVVATGTGNRPDGEVTEVLLSAAARGGNVSEDSKVAKAVQWTSMATKAGHKRSESLNSFGAEPGAVCALHTAREVASIRWHKKGDYFVTVSPKAGAAAVLIHQLSKGTSQQPFSKAKSESQVACFHPSKPFLFVCSQNHVRVYHLVKQTLVKRMLMAAACLGCFASDIYCSVQVWYQAVVGFRRLIFILEETI